MLVACPLFLLYTSSGFSLLGFYLVTVLQQAGSALPPLQVTVRLLLFCHPEPGFLDSGVLEIPDLLDLLRPAPQVSPPLLSPLLHPRVARRPLFLWTTLLVTLSLAGLGLYTYLSTLPNMAPTMANLSWLPILLIGLVFAGGQLGFSPVTKIIISEVFPTDLRSTGSSMVFLCGSLSLAILSKLFSQFLTW